MTRIFGVIGFPINHSLSPLMQTAALRALRLDALYAPFEVPLHFLSPMLKGLILAGIDGLNVTVPLKEAIVPLLDRLDPSAKAIGAVNTVVVRDNQLIGCNTDGKGFVLALKELGWRPHPVRIVLIGAGGAGRAVAFELSRIKGAHLAISDLRYERARRLSHWLNRQRPRARIEAKLLSCMSIDKADLLVNATTAGMRASDRPPVDARKLRRGAFVYDLVYHRETALVRAARRRGCVAANGLSMLLYQGAESLRLWLRRKPPIQVMRRALECALAAKARR